MTIPVCLHRQDNSDHWILGIPHIEIPLYTNSAAYKKSYEKYCPMWLGIATKHNREYSPLSANIYDEQTNRYGTLHIDTVSHLNQNHYYAIVVRCALFTIPQIPRAMAKYKLDHSAFMRRYIQLEKDYLSMLLPRSLVSISDRS